MNKKKKKRFGPAIISFKLKGKKRRIILIKKKKEKESAHTHISKGTKLSQNINKRVILLKLSSLISYFLGCS